MESKLGCPDRGLAADQASHNGTADQKRTGLFTSIHKITGALYPFSGKQAHAYDKKQDQCNTCRCPDCHDTNASLFHSTTQWYRPAVAPVHISSYFISCLKCPDV